jgi:hypothetical protein
LRKRLVCIDCSKTFYISPFSRTHRCKSCRAVYRQNYIRRWKRVHKDRVKIWNRKYYLGTIHPDELEVVDGHVAGWTKLERMTGSIGG